MFLLHTINVCVKLMETIFRTEPPKKAARVETPKVSTPPPKKAPTPPKEVAPEPEPVPEPTPPSNAPLNEKPVESVDDDLSEIERRVEERKRLLAEDERKIAELVAKKKAEKERQEKREQGKF